MATNNNNYEMVKAIADEIDYIIQDDLLRCPECGEQFHRDDSKTVTDEDGTEIYTCPDCGSCVDEYDVETVSLYDYFESALDIEYTINGRFEYRGVRIMVACGGPNIYINTNSGEVELYWWTESATAELSRPAINAIDEIFEDQFNCLR